MKSLVEVYNQLPVKDQELLEKQAADKIAADEQDAAGRIMARGFADELNMLSELHEKTANLTGNPPGGFGPSMPGGTRTPKPPTGMGADPDQVKGSPQGGFKATKGPGAGGTMGATGTVAKPPAFPKAAPAKPPGM
jgi:hypothetical protein